MFAWGRQAWRVYVREPLENKAAQNLLRGGMIQCGRSVREGGGNARRQLLPNLQILRGLHFMLDGVAGRGRPLVEG